MSFTSKLESLSIQQLTTIAVIIAVVVISYKYRDEIKAASNK